MEGVKNKVKVNILGGEYNILTDEDESRVQAIAAFVDKQITDTKAMSPQMTTMNAAILALLNLSEELYATKSELDEYKKKEDELDKSADAAKELESLKQELAANDSKVKSLKTRAEKLLVENGELNDMLDEYKDKFNALRTEYELNKRTLSDLQNKFLENQIELVKARKTLLDFND